MHTYIHTYMDTYIHTSICMFIFVRPMQYVRPVVYNYTNSSGFNVSIILNESCTSVFGNTQTHTYIHTYIHTYTCLHFLIKIMNNLIKESSTTNLIRRSHPRNEVGR